MARPAGSRPAIDRAKNCRKGEKVAGDRMGASATKAAARTKGGSQTQRVALSHAGRQVASDSSGVAIRASARGQLTVEPPSPTRNAAVRRLQMKFARLPGLRGSRMKPSEIAAAAMNHKTRAAH